MMTKSSYFLEGYVLTQEEENVSTQLKTTLEDVNVKRYNLQCKDDNHPSPKQTLLLQAYTIEEGEKFIFWSFFVLVKSCFSS